MPTPFCSHSGLLGWVKRLCAWQFAQSFEWAASIRYLDVKKLWEHFGREDANLATQNVYHKVKRDARSVSEFKGSAQTSMYRTTFLETTVCRNLGRKRSTSTWWMPHWNALIYEPQMRSQLQTIVTTMLVRDVAFRESPHLRAPTWGLRVLVPSWSRACLHIVKILNAPLARISTYPKSLNRKPEKVT